VEPAHALQYHPRTDRIGLEDDVHPVLQDARTVPADAYRLPDGALRAIRADQVLGANTALRTGRSIANPRDDLIMRLREAHQIRVEAHVGAMPLGMGTQDRFELILIAGRGRRGTDVAGVRRRNPLPRHLGVGQVLHPGDRRRPVVDQIAVADLGFDPRAAIDLHRPGRDPAELVLNGRLGMAFENQTWHTASCEEHRHGQPVQAAADDENGRVGVHVTIFHIGLVLSSIRTIGHTHSFAARMGLKVNMSKSATDALARRVWQALFDLLIRSAPARTASLARRGLTPNDSRALFSLDPRTGRSMRSLADDWQCDPSNATFIVDHLEELGLASRQPLLHDKRVKLVVLTRKGEKTRADLLREFHQPPAEFDGLDRLDLEALERIVTKLTSVPTPAVASRHR
jgi:DNA-binding MarR family transcriptional regulator